MTRRLIFDGPRAAQRFVLLRLAVLLGGDGKGERTREVLRKEARLLDALDTVSDPAPTEADPDARVLKPTGGGLLLGQEDFELLTRYVDVCAWLPRAARAAVDLQDWLSAAERRD